MSVIRRSIDLNSSSGVAQLVVAIIFGVLATLSVVLRFVSRRISRVYLSINDYAIVIALVRASLDILRLSNLKLIKSSGSHVDPSTSDRDQYALQYLAKSGSILIISGVAAGGAGMSKHQLSDSEIRIFWKSMYVIIISWPVAQSMTKISILLFYIHLFPTRVFSYAAYSLIVVVTAWMIQQILASLVLCRPISINWDASVNGSCGNVAANCLAGAGINTLQPVANNPLEIVFFTQPSTNQVSHSTDILILILPMPIIWRLHVPLRNKLILSLIFGLGSLICIISIIRLKALLSYTTAPMMLPPFDSDGPRTNSMSILYTVLESCLGVICACLVIMKPIFTNSKFFNSLGRKINSWGSSSSNGSREAKGRIPSWEHGTQQQHPGTQDLRIMKTCEIDVELDAAMVAQERRGQRLDHTHILTDMRREGGMMVDERSASESTISTSLRGGRSEAEVRRGV
ncbi:MAG: hypothetical protein Q9180_003232 [Flavoplaca navasiana]